MTTSWRGSHAPPCPLPSLPPSPPPAPILNISRIFRRYSAAIDCLSTGLRRPVIADPCAAPSHSHSVFRGTCFLFTSSRLSHDNNKGYRNLISMSEDISTGRKKTTLTGQDDLKCAGVGRLRVKNNFHPSASTAGSCARHLKQWLHFPLGAGTSSDSPPPRLSVPAPALHINHTHAHAHKHTPHSETASCTPALIPQQEIMEIQKNENEDKNKNRNKINTQSATTRTPPAPIQETPTPALAAVHPHTRWRPVP